MNKILKIGLMKRVLLIWTLIYWNLSGIWDLVIGI